MSWVNIRKIRSGWGKDKEKEEWVGLGEYTEKEEWVV